jgi:hypothetical protein
VTAPASVHVCQAGTVLHATSVPATPMVVAVTRAQAVSLESAAMGSRGLVCAGVIPGMLVHSVTSARMDTSKAGRCVCRAAARQTVRVVWMGVVSASRVTLVPDVMCASRITTRLAACRASA